MGRAAVERQDATGKQAVEGVLRCFRKTSALPAFGQKHNASAHLRFRHRRYKQLACRPRPSSQKRTSGFGLSRIISETTLVSSTIIVAALPEPGWLAHRFAWWQLQFYAAKGLEQFM